MSSDVGRAVLDLPETNLALHAFLVHFVWEVHHFRLYSITESLSHVDCCTRAAAGDAVLVLGGYWFASAVAGRRWILRPRRTPFLAFVGVGLDLAIGIEVMSVRMLGRWSYSDSMPLVPILGIGVSPVLQWLVLPPIILGLSKRSLEGGRTSSAPGPIRRQRSHRHECWPGALPTRARGRRPRDRSAARAGRTSRSRRPSARRSAS